MPVGYLHVRCMSKLKVNSWRFFFVQFVVIKQWISKPFAIGNTGVSNTVFNNLSEKLKCICGRYMPLHVSLIFDFTGTIKKNCCANFVKFVILQMLQFRENIFVKLFFGNSFLMKSNSPEDDCNICAKQLLEVFC